jgi:ubiquinol-cytochrome c reductase cytochrome c subunit
MRRFFSITLGFAVVVALSVPYPAIAQGTAQSADHGRQLYMSNNCYLCHGTVGQGGAGPRLAPPSLKDESAFTAYVRDPKGRMPPYTAAVLSNTDLASIRGYLAALPAPPSQLPALLSRLSASH